MLPVGRITSILSTVQQTKSNQIKYRYSYLYTAARLSCVENRPAWQAALRERVLKNRIENGVKKAHRPTSVVRRYVLLAIEMMIFHERSTAASSSFVTFLLSA